MASTTALGCSWNSPSVAVHGGDRLVAGQVQHHGVQLVGDTELLRLLNEAGRVLGAGQLLLEGVQAEAVVDALVQNAAQLVVPLEDEQVLHPVAGGLRWQLQGRPARRQ